MKMLVAALAGDAIADATIIAARQTDNRLMNSLLRQNPKPTRSDKELRTLN
jgi:hypothetical protein